MPQQIDANALLEYKYYLQPHVHLFQMPYDLFAFRLEFLKHAADNWI